MRLSRDDQVAGIPATDARKLMRRFGDAQPESRIGSWVDTGSRTGTEVARAFADAGYLRASGRRFRNLLDALSWPEQEALQILRNRSAVINITREDVRTLTDRWEVVYSYDGP